MSKQTEPRVAGDVVWHSTEEDGGPDVGLHVGLGGGRSLWVSEISRREWDEYSPETKAALGDDNGWWIVLYDGKDRFVLGKCGDQYEVHDAIDRIAHSLRIAPAAPPKDAAP